VRGLANSIGHIAQHGAEQPVLDALWRAVAIYLGLNPDVATYTREGRAAHNYIYYAYAYHVGAF
jgi:hypothetical protein